MAILLSNIKRIIKDKKRSMLTIIFPVILIAFSLMQNIEGHLVVGIIDNDNTKFTQSFISKIREQGEVIILKENEIETSILDKKTDYIIKIDKGFTEDIINGKDSAIHGYSEAQGNYSESIRMYVDELINAAKNIGTASHGDEKKFYEGFNFYCNGSYRAKYEAVNAKKADPEKTSKALGFMIMSILMFSYATSNMILKDKESKIYYRIFSTPISAKRYSCESILSFIAVSALQIALLFIIMVKFFKANFGPSPTNMYLVLLIFSLSCIALGVLINSLAKNLNQAFSLNTLITMPLCMLGGCFWPVELMPGFLRNISNFLPTTWGIKAARSVLFTGTLTSVRKELIIIFMFSVVFFLLSSWKKTDISKTV